MALYKAWIWLTGALTGAAAETAKSTAAMAEGMNKAAEAAAKIEDEVDAAYRAAQQGDAAASTVEEFAAQLTAAGVGADEYQRRITALDVKLGQTEAIKKRAKALQDLADLQRKAGLAGRSENMKTVIELRSARPECFRASRGDPGARKGRFAEHGLRAAGIWPKKSPRSRKRPPRPG